MTQVGSAQPIAYYSLAGERVAPSGFRTLSALRAYLLANSYQIIRENSGSISFMWAANSGGWVLEARAEQTGS